MAGLELSCALPAGPEAIEHARLAEELGYARVWLYDSPALYADVWITLARIAERTRRIGIGPGVLVPSLRHVVAAASAISTLEQLAPGRVAVTLGTGFTGRMLLGKRPLAWSVVADYARTLRGLLSGDEVELQGRCLKLLQPPGFVAARPLATPILVAANGPRGREVARSLGDGILCTPEPAPGFRWCAVASMGTVLEAGEGLHSERAAAALAPAIALIYHETWERGGAVVDALPGGAAWRTEVESIPAVRRHLSVHDGHGMFANEFDSRHLGTAAAEFTLSGTRASLRERIDGLRAGGMTELVYAPMGPQVERELRCMAEVVVSASEA